MARKRLSMRKIKEILRLSLGEGRSQREVARSVSASRATVADCLARAGLAGLSWPLAPELDEAALEERLYPRSEAAVQRAKPDLAYLHRELRRKGVTLMLLWQEYKKDHPEDGYQYSQFCQIYRRFHREIDVVMRQEHRAGEKMFVDFSGDGINIIDRDTGLVSKAELFVAVLGASSYTYAEAFPSQKLAPWIMGHIHSYEYFHGVPELTIPDNPKSGVTHPCRYEPDLNPTYHEMAEHYGTAIIPARPRKPRDKAKVEGGVLIAQRWILAALRNHTFFSIAQANAEIFRLVEEINRRPFQKLDGCRLTAYQEIDRPALRPLPAKRYEIAEWAKPRVNIDYHVEVDKHWYSAPFQLVGRQLDARITLSTVELFHRGNRVASHARSREKGRYTTVREHMPKAHQRYLEWTPTRIIAWARKTGPETARLAEAILTDKPHPEQGYRACLGILRLGKTYGAARVETACARALAIGSVSYKSVKSILKTGMDRQPLLQAVETKPEPILHENLRGPAYYQEDPAC